RLTLQAGGGQMEPDRVAMLRQPIENRLKQFKTLKSQQEFEQEQSAGRQTGHQKQTSIALHEQNRQKQVSDLMKHYNELYRAAKYDDAEVVALQAKDLDPETPIITAAVSMAHMHRNKKDSDNINREGAEQWLQAEHDASHFGPPVTSHDPLILDLEVAKRARARKGSVADILISSKSQAEQRIERQLTGQVSVNFVDKPLRAVLDELCVMQGVNIVPDRTAMEE